MAGQGPSPKDAATRRRRNADPHARHALVADGRVRGPKLPPLVDEQWHPMTLRWWNTWRRSPQAQSFLATDWDFLLDTALMHHTMWSRDRWEFASELRLRVSKFGATTEDRARLRMEVVQPDAASTKRTAGPGSVTDIASRRKRLTTG